MARQLHWHPGDTDRAVPVLRRVVGKKGGAVVDGEGPFRRRARPGPGPDRLAFAPPALLILILVALGAATPWSLLLTAPVVVVAARRVRSWDSVTLGGALLVAGTILGLFATVNLQVSLTALAGIVGAIAVTILLTRWWHSGAPFGSVLGSYVAVACLIVLIGTIQVDIAFAKLNALSQVVYAWFSHWPHLDNVGFSQNATGALIVAVCPFAIAYAFGSRSRWWRIAAWLAAAWLIFALILTLSRGAYLGLALGFGAMIWLRGGWARWLAPLPTLITVGLLMAGVTGYEFTLSPTPTGWSSADRLYIWHAALRMLADFPISGPGAGTFPLRMPAYTWPMEARDIPHAHNVLLQTYLDSGVLGLVGLLLLLVAATTGTLRLLARPLDRRARLALLGAAGAFTGTLAQAFVDAYFWGDPRTFYVVVIPLAVLLASARLEGVDLAWSMPRLERTVASRGAALGRAGCVALATRRPPALAGALLGLALLTAVLRPVGSLFLTNSGNILREHGEFMAAGSAGQNFTFAVAQHQLQAAGLLAPGYGAAWQDVAEVFLDERDTAQASFYLWRADQADEHDALVARDDTRLSRLAVAQASPSLRAPH